MNELELLRDLGRHADEQQVPVQRRARARLVAGIAASTGAAAPVGATRRVAPGLGRYARPVVAALAVVAVAAALLVVGPSGGSSVAWASKPTELTADMENRIRNACEQLLNMGERTPRQLPPTDVIDLRGTYAIAWFAGPDDVNSLVECSLDTAQLPASGPVDLEAARATGGPSNPMGAADVDDEMPVNFELSSGENFTSVVGVRSPEIDRMTVDIPGLGEAEASLSGIRFVVWWPGSYEGVMLRAYDAQGRLLHEEPVWSDLPVDE